MKRLRNKIIILILTFAIGVFSVAIWFIKFKPDSNVYSVNFCDLMQESKQYDRKILEINAFYKQGFEASFLSDSDCKDLITATCFLGNDSCDKIFNALRDSADRQVKITVIGKYRDSEYQMYDGYVHKIEILEIKNSNTSQTSK